MWQCVLYQQNFQTETKSIASLFRLTSLKCNILDIYLICSTSFGDDIEILELQNDLLITFTVNFKYLQHFAQSVVTEISWELLLTGFLDLLVTLCKDVTDLHKPTILE